VYPSPIDRFATLRLFFIAHNRGLVGSQKVPYSKFLLSIPTIFVIFPICIKCGLMLITSHAGSKTIAINKRRARGYFSLNCIKERFSKGYIIVISLKGFISSYYPIERTLSSTYGNKI
jgi:hypothetical protein